MHKFAVLTAFKINNTKLITNHFIVVGFIMQKNQPNKESEVKLWQELY